MSRAVCCAAWKSLSIGVAIGLVFCLGVVVGSRFLAHETDSKSASASGELPADLQEMLLRADSAHGGASIGMATGMLDENVEALFVLDYLTGNLFCWVPSPAGGWMAQFEANVEADFGGVDKEKTPDYVMTTGFINPARGTAVGRPAQCVCYVADGNTGRVLAYTFSWNRTRAQQGGDAGLLVKMAEGITRANIERN